jgi:hypothetical protein
VFKIDKYKIIKSFMIDAAVINEELWKWIASQVKEKAK